MQWLKIRRAAIKRGEKKVEEGFPKLMIRKNNCSNSVMRTECRRMISKAIDGR